MDSATPFPLPGAIWIQPFRSGAQGERLRIFISSNSSATPSSNRSSCGSITKNREPRVTRIATSSLTTWVASKTFGTFSPLIWIVQACAPLLCHEFARFVLAKRDFGGRQTFRLVDTSNRVSEFSLNRGKPSIRSESSLTHLLLHASSNVSGIRPTGKLLTK